jgi:hypothetical protein
MNFALGEIVGHRYWVVSWGGNLFGPHSWSHWHPTEPMTGNVTRNGHAGVFALKTKNLVEQFVADTAARRELARTWRSAPLLPPHGLEGPIALAVGTVSLWGTIWEHTTGFRAQFGRVRTIDVWLEGEEYDRRQTASPQLDRLRTKYGCADLAGAISDMA